MTRQFDVFENPLRAGRAQRPYLMVVQHPFYDNLPSRVVAPLVIPETIRTLSRLNPVLILRERKLHFSPTEVFTISLSYLRDPIANLEADRDAIIAALDLVFTGI